MDKNKLWSDAEWEQFSPETRHKINLLSLHYVRALVECEAAEALIRARFEDFDNTPPGMLTAKRVAWKRANTSRKQLEEEMNA